MCTNMGGKVNGKAGFESQIPDSQDFIPVRLPQLEGSEKQIEWARQIRSEILQDLAHYTISYTSDGRTSGLYKIARQGKKAIIDDIKDNRLVSGSSGKLHEEKIKNAIDSYKDLAARMRRYNDIAKNPSAKFWIDNRTNQRENYLNDKLKRKIDGK